MDSGRRGAVATTDLSESESAFWEVQIWRHSGRSIGKRNAFGAVQGASVLITH